MTDPAALRESWRRSRCDAAVAELRARGESAEVAVDVGCSHVVWTRADGMWWLLPVRSQRGTRWAVRDELRRWPSRWTMDDAVAVAKENA